MANGIKTALLLGLLSGLLLALGQVLGGANGLMVGFVAVALVSAMYGIFSSSQVV